MSLGTISVPGIGQLPPVGYSPFSPIPTAAQVIQQYNSATIAQAIANYTNINGAAPIITATRDLSQAEIQNWQGSGGYEVLAAGGANILWSPVRWWFEKFQVGAVYTVNITLTCVYTGTALSAGLNTITSNLNATAYQIGCSAPVSFIGTAASQFKNRGITITANGNPGGGLVTDRVRLVVEAIPLVCAS